MSNEKEDLKAFKITPYDLYNFYIKGLHGIGESEKKLVTMALRRSYLLGYSQGTTNGIKVSKEKFINSFKILDYEV